MLVKLAKATAILAMASGSVLLSAGGASAAHCVSPAGEPSSPGFSYFGTDHVKGTAHDSEGQGVHMGTSGASNCRDTTGSPSERAPGKNR